MRSIAANGGCGYTDTSTTAAIGARRSPRAPWSPIGSVNVSVEVIDYTPVLISDLLQELDR